MRELIAQLLAAVALLTGGGPAKSDEPISIKQPSLGHNYGLLSLPRLQLKNWIIREGARPSELNRGFGHVKSTFEPGMGGTIAFFCHRVTPVLSFKDYGPCRFLPSVRPGDKLIVKMPYGRYVYENVGKGRAIGSKAWKHFDPKLTGERLYIAACHPPNSKKYRWVEAFVRVNT